VETPEETTTWRNFILKNFATPIAFYVTFHEAGPKPAIALAVIVTLLQVMIHRYYKSSVSPFFIVASGFTILFGGTDLLIQNPRYFRLEPFVQNFVLGTVFLITVLAKIPIAEWFASALPNTIRPHLATIRQSYLRRVTLVWTVYFYLKALLFLYLAFQVNLGELIVLRSIIGGSTLALMIAGEIYYRNRFYRP